VHYEARADQNADPLPAETPESSSCCCSPPFFFFGFVRRIQLLSLRFADSSGNSEIFIRFSEFPTEAWPLYLYTNDDTYYFGALINVRAYLLIFPGSCSRTIGKAS
jgi:hypothetical protein